jgi:hypothetical protein
MGKNKFSPIFHFSRLKYPLLFLLIIVVIVGSILYRKAEYVVLGAECYMFGYPLVIMDVTRAGMALTLGRENHLLRVRNFPDADFKGIVRPNEDTLYTIAYIDMNKGPWVFEIASNNMRYEVMQFLDAWTNVFAAPGTRTIGTTGGKFLLVWSSWQGRVPAGLTLLRSPTQIVWLLGRTQTNGAADYPTVHRLQDGIKLHSFADWQTGLTPREPAIADGQTAGTKPLHPILQMQQMNMETFFTRLSMLMVNNPPSAADGPMLVKLSRINVRPGQPPQWNWLDRLSIALGRWIADFTVARELKTKRDLVRGWTTPPSILGNYGTFYNTRAVTAMIGLGANLPADAIYPSAQVDAEGQALNGKHNYRLHFRADGLPPVNAFWSLTAYGSDNFFIPNPINRYSLGDRSSLVFNADGSLDILVQADRPEKAKENNWLPVKAGEPFLLCVRLYWPKPAALNGTWGMPAVERIK